MQPNDFWRKTVNQAALVEIRVLGNNSEAIVCRVLPDSGVSGLSHTEEARLGCADERAFQLGDKFVGKVLVEQEFQAA